MTVRPGAGHGRGVAYLVSEYPALSHVFVESEVAALRGLGWRVETFSVRPTELADHGESPSTTALQAAGARTFLSALLRLILMRPASVSAGVRAATRAGARTSLRRRLWQYFYFAEAVVLHHHMRRRGLQHVHAHFANNSADIARLTTAIGRAVDGDGTWTWSLAVHGPTEFENADRYDLPGKVASAAFVACITDYCRSQVMRHVDEGHWPRLHVVRMGVSSVEALPRTPPPLTVPGRGVDPLRVLYVGRLVAEKGPRVLLDAIDAMASARAGGDSLSGTPVVDLVVIGAGSLEEGLRRRIEQLHPAVTVKLLGGLPHDQVIPWYAWADVFCLPSFAEGLPVVLMEALAHGVPVVTTPIAGIPELVIDGGTGLLVAPGRHDALATALSRLATDPELRLQLGSSGRAAVERLHDAGTNGILLAGLLARTIEEGRRCAGPPNRDAETLATTSGEPMATPRR